MRLRETFYFQVKDHPETLYLATYTSLGGTRVSWAEDGSQMCMQYGTLQVEKFIASGEWVMIPASSFSIQQAASELCILISEKRDASELSYKEVKELRLTRGLITRLLDDGY